MSLSQEPVTEPSGTCAMAPDPAKADSLDDLETATVAYIDWYDNRRLHGELGHVPPAEHEALHAMTHPVTAPQKTN